MTTVEVRPAQPIPSCANYHVMTTVEVVAGTYTHLIKTGETMFREKFTRVVEQTATKEFADVCHGQTTSHLFVGRFNLSGLNNDAYLDVGGDHCKHDLRGLSLCRRFAV